MRFKSLLQIISCYGAIVALCAVVACGTSQPAQPDAAMIQSETALPLVFIPGLNGSLLEDPQSKSHWLTVPVALALSTPQLALPLQWENGNQKGDDLRPAGVVMDVSLISGVIGQDVYAPWVKFAGQITDRPLHIFSYDWRRDNNESSARFEAFLDELSQRYGGKKVQVVSHSMGGMITLTVLNRRPELFDRVVFTGVPFRGGIGYMDNMHLGVSIGLNSKLLSPEVLFSHPSVYSFYPAGQSFENTDVLRDENEAPLQLDFYDPEVWAENGFGVFAAASANWRGNPDERRVFLKDALRVARKFRVAMRPKHSAGKYPPVLVVGSKSHATLHHIKRKPISSSSGSDQKTPEWEFNATAPEPGDGSVLYRDMLPPDPIKHSVTLSDYQHAFLLNDPKMQKQVARFLHESQATKP